MVELLRAKADAELKNNAGKTATEEAKEQKQLQAEGRGDPMTQVFGAIENLRVHLTDVLLACIIV